MRVIWAKTPAWSSTAMRLEELVGGAEFREFKANGRTLAGFLRDGTDEVFVKRVATGSWLRGLAERVRGSRARRALRGARLLQSAGFAHPEPLAAVEACSWGAVRASYLVCDALGQAQVLSEFALLDGRVFARRRQISERVAREVRRLHDSGIYTRDLQETNLMLEAADTQLKVYFVDLEDFRRMRRVSMRRRMRNLVHLDRSIGRFVSRSQRLRFFYNYMAGRPSPREARRLVRRLMKIGARKLPRLNQTEPRNGVPRASDNPLAAGALLRTGDRSSSRNHEPGLGGA